MLLDKLTSVAEEVKTRIGEAGTAALDQLGKSQRELNQAIPVLKSLGLSVRNFRLELALVPVIRLTMIGSVAAIEPDRLQRVIETHRDDKVLVSVLEALRTAALLKDQLGDVGFRGVSADVVLTVPPSVNVEFMKDPPAPDV